ncbi:hypothetical protein CSIM01_06143 [Colletotrichum simmondsii]|uniref:Uncharacterized protein n=1 Tax=Colletotrichum simmondsii TaxID=703756 RepID=A0A135SNC3_9PEZI|nr:hypothetical protein CSIM01_06143 [Colletotrichum simmondsii]
MDINNLSIRVKESEASADTQIMQNNSELTSGNIDAKEKAARLTRGVVQILQRSGADPNYIQAFAEQQEAVIALTEEAVKEADQTTLASKNMLKYANHVGPELAIAAEQYQFLSEDYRDSKKQMQEIGGQQSEIMNKVAAVEGRLQALEGRLQALEGHMSEIMNKVANLESLVAKVYQTMEKQKKESDGSKDV